MLNKVFARGVGKGKGPVLYCISAISPVFDPITRRKIKGEFRVREPAPVVLKGDPSRTIALIDSIVNKWKYTSGVLAFTVDDNPSVDEQMEVIESFEKFAFAGLQPGQYDILWTRHLHEGNVELHYVSPRIELKTGKAMNIAPPGFEKSFDAWRDSLNYSRGWSSPDEPDRARLGRQDSHTIKADKAKLKAQVSLANDPKRLITQYLVACVTSGKVKNRKDVLSALSAAGFFINRIGKDYLSVRVEEMTKPIRLKGVLYGEGFEANFNGITAARDEPEYDGELDGAAEDHGTAGGWRNTADDAKRAAAASKRLAEATSRRAEYNQNRYRKPGIGNQNYASRDRQQRETGAIGMLIGHDGTSKSNQSFVDRSEPGDEASIAADSRKHDTAANRPLEASFDADKTALVAIEIADIGERFSNLRRLLSSHLPDLGVAANPFFQHRNAQPDLSGGWDLSGYHGPRLEHLPARGERRMASVQEDRSITLWSAARADLEKSYDRTGNPIIVGVLDAFQTIRAGHETLVRSEFSLAAAITGFEHANAGIGFEKHDVDFCLQQTDRSLANGVRLISRHRDDEIAHFNSMINLVNFAESLGYRIDPRDSSRAAVLMRQQDDCIVVMTDNSTGYGIYFSLKNKYDMGFIFDFVQRSGGKSPAEARKLLRGWVSAPCSPLPLSGKVTPRNWPIPIDRWRQEIVLAWASMQELIRYHPYLPNLLFISPDTPFDRRFLGLLRLDKQGNLVFPQFDRDGIAGYELTHPDISDAIHIGKKALWRSSNVTDAKFLFVVQSPIEAFSHFEMHSDLDSAYISIGTELCEGRSELLVEEIEDLKMRRGTLILATDNDDIGHSLANQIANFAAGVALTRQTPASESWNGDLIAWKAIAPSI